MKTDINTITKQMDEALMSDDPLSEFKKLLPKIKQYKTVDSTWITGYSVWVKFKDGGKLSWIIPHENQNTNTINLSN